MNKGALIDFKPAKQFDLNPGNADAFATQLETISKQFSYHGILKRVPTTRTVDAADATIITFGDNKNVLESWNQLTLDQIHLNANQTWGDQSWTPSDPRVIVPLSNARGELGVANVITTVGKALFLKRWRSIMMANHALQSLTPAARMAIKTGEEWYEWYNDDTGETAQDGLTVITLILQKMRPDVRINVFNELARIKTIALAQHSNSIVEWTTAMEQSRISIALKCPGAYPDDQYIMDLFKGALEAKCKTFVSKVQSMKQSWLNRTLADPTKEGIIQTMVQWYSNMFDDGTRKKEFDETDQVIALTTMVYDLKKKLDSNTVSLATSTTK